MARDFSQVKHTFWTGRTGMALRGDAMAQAVALYLITCRHSNAIGLYYLPIMYAAHETGHSVEDVRATLARLESTGFVRYDDATEYVWVVGMARYQHAKPLKPGDKNVQNVHASLREATATAFYAEFWSEYESYLCLTGGDLPRPSEGAPSKPLRSPLEAPSKPLPVAEEAPPKGHPLEKEKEKEKERDAAGAGGRARAYACESGPGRTPDTPPADVQIDPEPLMDLRTATDMLSRGPGESMAAREARRLFEGVYVPACRAEGKVAPRWSRMQIVQPFVRLVVFAAREAPDDPDAARRMLTHAITDRWRVWGGSDKLLEPGAILADAKLDTLLAQSAAEPEEERVKGRTEGPDGVMYRHTCVGKRHYLRDQASGERRYEWVGEGSRGEWRPYA